MTHVVLGVTSADIRTSKALVPLWEHYHIAKERPSLCAQSRRPKIWPSWLIFLGPDNRQRKHAHLFFAVNFGGLILQALLEHWPRTHTDEMCGRSLCSPMCALVPLEKGAFHVPVLPLRWILSFSENGDTGTEPAEKRGGNPYFAVPLHTPVIFRFILHFVTRAEFALAAVVFPFLISESDLLYLYSLLPKSRSCWPHYVVAMVAVRWEAGHCFGCFAGMLLGRRSSCCWAKLFPPGWWTSLSM